MSRFDEIEAILTNLGEAATADQFEFALRDYPDRDVRTVLAERAAAGGGGGGVQSASLTLTNDEIKALGAITVEDNYPTIVAEPPAGKMNYYMNGFLVVDLRGGAYTGSVGYVWIGQDNLGFGDVSSGVIILDKSVAMHYAPLGGPKMFETEFVAETTVDANKAPGRLFLGSGANFISPGVFDPYGGGHADNSLTVVVYYVELDYPLA